jgi:predicted dehydrogenase
MRSGVLGSIVGVIGSAVFYKPDFDGYFEGPYAWRREPGGGPILINMIHDVGNLRAMVGEVVAVQAMASNATRKFAVEDTVAIMQTRRMNWSCTTTGPTRAAAAR